MRINKSTLLFGIILGGFVSVISANLKNDKMELEFYRSGVNQYLNGNDQSAISDLSQVLRYNEKNEKARKLLLKSSLRAMDVLISKNDVEGARALVSKVREFLPGQKELDKPFETIPRRIEPERVVSAPTPRVAREIEKPKPQKIRRVEPKVAPVQSTLEEVAEAGELIAAIPPQVNLMWIVVALGSWIVVLLIVIFIVLFVFKRNKQEMLTQMERLMDTKKKEEQEIFERLALKKREAEEKSRLEIIEKFKRDEQIKRDLRTAQELRMRQQREAEATRAKFSSTEPPKVNIQKQEIIVDHYQKQIQDLMADVPSPKKREAWDRIATQILNLYAASKEAAIQFLQNLAKDESATARAGTVAVLAEIRSPETLEILFKLHADPHPDVQREVLKHLKALLNDSTNGISAESMEKMQKIYMGETEKGEWII